MINKVALLKGQQFNKFLYLIRYHPEGSRILPMKSKFLNRRELLVLGLPFLLIGAGAVCFNAREKQRIARESGPWRLVVTDAQAIAITPKEAWQGYDLKYRLNYELHGEQPPNLKTPVRIPYAGANNPNNAFLDIINERENTERFSGIQIGGGTYWERYLRAPLKVVDDDHGPLFRTILIDRNAFPRGKMILKSHTQAQATNSNNEFLQPLPAEWSQTVNREVKPVEINRASPKLISSSLNFAPPIASQRRIAMNTYVYGSGTSKALTKLKLNCDLSDVTKNPVSNNVAILNSRFEDEKGNEIRVKSESDQYGGQRMYTHQGNVRSDVNKQDYVEMELDLHDVPTEHGAIFLRSNLSLNNSWATPFLVEVRPAWVCRKTSKLKIEKVEVEGSAVSVRVHYLGTKPMELRGSSGIGTSNFSMMDGSSDWGYDPPVPTGHDRLIINWSQHLEDSNGPMFFNPKQPNTDSPEETCEVIGVEDLGNNRYVVNYSVNYKPKSPMKFKAEIGIWGDGFIPVEATIK